MTRLAQLRLLVAASALAVACRAHDLPATTSAANEPRPAGVVFDPPEHRPPVQSRGVASQQLSVLAEPRPVWLAQRVVQQFFQAVVKEDLVALKRVLSPNAQQLTSRQQSQRALDHWTRRLQRAEYGDLTADLIYSPTRVRAYDSEQSPAVAGEKDAHLMLRPGELLVVVPLSPAVAGSSRFGKVIELALTEVAGEYTIRAIREDFEIP